MLRAPTRVTLGKYFSRFVHPDYLSIFEGIFERGLRSGAKGEVYLIRGKEFFPAYISVRALLTENSRNACIIVTDLTGQKQNERIGASERFTNQVIEQVGEAIIVCDKSGVVIRASKLTNNLAGKNILLKNIKTALLLRHHKTGARFSFERVLKGITFRNIEVKLRRGNKVFDVMLNAKPLIDTKNGVIGSIITLNDITERKRAEEDLRESKESYRRLVETANEGVWQVDIDFRTTYINARMAEMLGCTVAEVIGRYRSDFMPPEEFEDVKLRQANSLRGITEVYECKLIRKDGSVLWAVVSASPLRDKEGQIYGSFGMFTDITQRKQMEEDLLKLNRILTAISSNNQAIIRSKNESDYLNQVCSIVTGNCGYSTVWIGYARNDEKKTIIPVAQSGFDEAYINSLNMTWDDSELGHGPAGTTVRHAQPVVCRDLHTDPHFKPWREEALKRGYASLIVLPLITETNVFGVLNIYSKKINPFSDGEVKLLEELAGDLAYGVMYIRMREKNTEAEEILKQNKESLERLVLERSQQLLDTHMELEKSKRLSDIGVLAATVAHELRNPLAAINMAASNIERKAKNPLLCKHLENIEKKVKESDQIISNLLFYSRIRNPHYENVNLNQVIEECVEALPAPLKSGKITIGKDIASTKNTLIQVDSLQMKEVISNILNNSFDAVSMPGGRIEIYTENGLDYVNICVKDNGVGIDKEQLKKVFEPFFTTKAKGTGLGLAVCRQIIDLHGGSIRIESENKAGTSVFITLRKKGNRNK